MKKIIIKYLLLAVLGQLSSSALADEPALFVLLTKPQIDSLPSGTIELKKSPISLLFPSDWKFKLSEHMVQGESSSSIRVAVSTFSINHTIANQPTTIQRIANRNSQIWPRTLRDFCDLNQLILVPVDTSSQRNGETVLASKCDSAKQRFFYVIYEIITEAHVVQIFFQGRGTVHERTKYIEEIIASRSSIVNATR
jgi:hypothetical protein